MSATLRLARPDDVPAILELQRIALGSAMPRERAFFDWKHTNSPFGQSFMLVAEDAEGLVGLRAMMRWRFQAGDRMIEAVRPVDTATHPRFRRRGLFKRLTMDVLGRLAVEGVQLVFNTPNDKSRPGYLKMGWTSVGPQTVWIRPAGRYSLRGGRAEAGDVRFPSVVDTRLHTARGEAYLEWRYRRAPRLGYHVHGDGEHGLIVRTRERFGRNELTLAEVITPRSVSGVLRTARLVRGVVRQSSADHALAMAAWGTREAAVLLRAGFVPAPKRGPHLVVREVPGAAPIPDAWRESRGWRVQVGDLEVF